MKAHTWIWRALACMALVVTVARSAPAQAPAADSRPAAIVNNETITMAELDANVKLMNPTAAQMPENERKQARFAMIGELIDDRLLQQFLRANGQRVTDADVAKMLAAKEAELRTEGHTLQELCKERGWTDAQLKEQISDFLRWTNYVNGRLSETDVKRYYDENRDFFDKVTVRASHIVFRVPAFSTEADRNATRAKLVALRNDILAGKIDFADAAKRFSQCASAPNGGDVGAFSRKGAVAEEFAKAAFALKVGEVSDVVTSDYGMHLIKLTERKPGQPSSFDKVKDDVRMMAAEELRQALLAQQRKTARVQILMGETVVKTSGQ